MSWRAGPLRRPMGFDALLQARIMPISLRIRRLSYQAEVAIDRSRLQDPLPGTWNTAFPIPVVPADDILMGDLEYSGDFVTPLQEEIYKTATVRLIGFLVPFIFVAASTSVY